MKRLAVALALLLSSQAFSALDTSPLISIAAGVHSPKRNQVWLFQAEYKGRLYGGVLRPQFGAMITTSPSYYFYGGIAFDLFFGRHIVFTPSFSPGVYIRGKGKDLGFPIEFRTCVELAYVFDNCSRLGVQGFHLSNASLAHHNPGLNAIALFYSFKL
jgi:hypothetical protein